MKRQSRGFTLIELIVVMVILGILAATAAPKFVNLQKDARIAALKGYESAIKSGNALLHAYASLHGLDDLSLESGAGINQSKVIFNGNVVERATSSSDPDAFFLNYGYVAVTYDTGRNPGLVQIISLKSGSKWKKQSDVYLVETKSYSAATSKKCEPTAGQELCYYAGGDKDMLWKIAFLVPKGYTAGECSLEYNAASKNKSTGEITPPVIKLHTDGC